MKIELTVKQEFEVKTLFIDAGVIINWQKGKTASIHYKVCDDEY